MTRAHLGVRPTAAAAAAVLCCFLLLPGMAGAGETGLPGIAAFTGDDRHVPGFLELWFSPDDGKLFAAIPLAGREVLYVNGLAAGVGSNDIGLDRGQIGNTRLVRLEVHADRVLVVQPNLAYRAESANADERRAVTEAFATSVLAALPVVARDDDRVLADLTAFALSDVHGVAKRLADTGQGSFSLDSARSVVAADGLAGFPRNTVVESILTFAGTAPGEYLREVTPTAEAVSVRIRHDFVAPPPAGFAMRSYHPRSGGFARGFVDYAAPLDAPLEQQIVVRHRLERDPQTGEVREPIVYYVDRGAPEPVRSALMEGAGWWAEAFAAAGFPGGFRVELLPEGASPLDIRYNVIQWVHRATRGWSYGWGVIDPRTGEIVKGHVTLGSQRVRQDLLIAEALTAPFGEGGDGGTAARGLALARLRQLAAHEVGHTLGLAHNFAASTQQDASVMDYPHPNITLGADGRVDLSRAYDTGIGAWDRHAIAYLYTAFPAGGEAAGLAALIADAADLAYVSDADARDAASAANPLGHLWDNGTDPIARLGELMRIREVALAGFSAAVIRDDAQLYTAEARLVPVYLLHRYQLEAVAKLIGGVSYRYGLRREAPPAPTPVDGRRQLAALEAMLRTLDPAALALPPSALAVMQPPGPDARRDREYFTHASGRVFDAQAPARAAAQLAADLLLDPTRAQRLLDQHALDAPLPGLDDTLARITLQLVRLPAGDDGIADAIAREVGWTFLRALQRLAVAPTASEGVRTAAWQALDDVREWARAQRADSAYARRVGDELARFAETPDPASLPAPHTVPPGSPI